MLYQAVHPRDSDRGQQAADGRRNQAYQQRHQHRQRELGAAVQPERVQRHDDEQKNDRQSGQQDAQRNFVGRLLTLRAFDQCDHAIEEGLAGVGGDLHLDPVGDDRGAAGDAAAIAAAFANDRCGFAGDSGLVDRRDTLDDFAVAGNHVAGRDHHDVVAPELRRRHQLRLIAARDDQFGLGFGARFAQVIGLRLAASFRHRLGEVCEQHGEPQPQCDLKFESGQRHLMRQQVAEQREHHQHAGDFDHEHHGILDHQARIELDERIDRRARDDFAIPKCGSLAITHVANPKPRRVSRPSSAVARRSARVRRRRRRSARRRL